MVEAEKLADPVVRQFVEAVNAGDRDALFALLTPNASMSDDGTERDLEQWVDREIFSSNGRMEVESHSDDGRSLIVNYTNSTWGAMRTAWKFVVEGHGWHAVTASRSASAATGSVRDRSAGCGRSPRG